MDTMNRSVARTPPATKLEIVGYEYQLKTGKVTPVE